jgi:hypothetical protein
MVRRLAEVGAARGRIAPPLTTVRIPTVSRVADREGCER